MTNNELIQLIEREAHARSIAPATLCKNAVQNNRIYKNLKAGRSCTLTVAEKICCFIKDNPP